MYSEILWLFSPSRDASVLFFETLAVDSQTWAKKITKYSAFPQRIKILVACNKRLQWCKTKAAMVVKRYSHMRYPGSHLCHTSLL